MFLSTCNSHNTQNCWRWLFNNVKVNSVFQCAKRGLEDEVVVGGSLGLDVSNMLVEDDICGLDSNPRKAFLIILRTTGRAPNSYDLT